MAGQNTQKDVVFDLDAASFSSDEFRIYHFKVRRLGLMAITLGSLTRYSFIADQALRKLMGSVPAVGAHNLVCVSRR
jgi:hypothetical protein